MDRERAVRAVELINALNKDLEGMKTSEQFGVGLLIGLFVGGVSAVALCAYVMKEESEHQDRIVEETRKAVSKEIQVQLVPVIGRIDKWSEAWFLQGIDAQ